MSAREHGTNAKYRLEKCRCGQCTEAAREYDRRYKERRRRNGGKPLMVDAEPVRRHLLAMMMGNRKGYRRDSVGPKSMAKASGVPHGAISRLLYGDYARGTPPSKRVRRETAERLLALTKEAAMSGGTAVPSGDTPRLIRSLVEFGIPKARIQDTIDEARGRNSSARLLQIARTGWVMKDVKQAIYRLHWRLWLTNPQFRWVCEVEPPPEIWAIFENVESIPASSYTQGWRYPTRRGATTEASRIAGKEAHAVVTRAADDTYRWYPSKDYVPKGERVVRRRVGGKWKGPPGGRGQLAKSAGVL